MLKRALRTITVRVYRIVAFTTWWVIGLWTALAVFFNAPLPTWLEALIALVIVAIFILATRERFRLYRWFATPWRAKRYTAAALVLTAAVFTCYFAFMHPNPNLEWESDHARVPHVSIQGNKIHIANVRDFDWQSSHGVTPTFVDRDYDLNAINSMNYVLCPLRGFDGIAHVFVCFGFSGGRHVAVSVEGRRAKGRPYRVFPSLFRQYQLIYVVGDERDVVGVRGAVWKSPVYFYPVRTSPQNMRAIFLDMMLRAHSLEEHPEYYNLITNNCLNNITHHLRRLTGQKLFDDLEVLFTGLSDRVAYNLGFLDTDLPFDKARQAYRADPWMQSTTLDDTFSDRLRAAIDTQVAKLHGS